MAAPIPSPEISRPTRRGVSDVPNAISSRPATFAVTPAKMSRRAWPRSATGAMRIWATKAVRNPLPMRTPMAVSEMPYSSRKSPTMVKSTP
jgi:hypothetical protein